MARHFGAEVTGVCSARNVESVRSLGARHVLDYTSGSWLDSAETYDLIFDTVGVTTFSGSRAALSAHGLYLPLNSGLREIVQALLTAFGKGKKVKYAVSANTREGLEFTLGLIESGAVAPVVDRVYPIAQIADAHAHRHVEGRHKRGSVIVTMEAA